MIIFAWFLLIVVIAVGWFFIIDMFCKVDRETCEPKQAEKHLAMVAPIKKRKPRSDKGLTRETKKRKPKK